MLQFNNIKTLLKSNTKLEDKLHVITVMSNPCDFKTRYRLTSEFVSRMEQEPNVILYVVELAYNKQEFKITSADNPRHLQLRGSVPLWHKENMINLGIRKLLPKDWKAVAWIDADIKFEGIHWAEDTLKILNGGKDVVQLFTHCVFMDYYEQISKNFIGFGYQYCNNFIKGREMNYWHPGFAWACTRAAYDKIGGIYELAILGAGDNIFCHAFIKKSAESLENGMSPAYIQSVKEYQDRFVGLSLGYVPVTISHYFHGINENRKYRTREDILIQYQYTPCTHVTTNTKGLIVPRDKCPTLMLDEIFKYFQDRNEDEYIHDTKMDLTMKLKFIQQYLHKQANSELNDSVRVFLASE
jgi:hypothetical protein